MLKEANLRIGPSAGLQQTRVGVQNSRLNGALPGVASSIMIFPGDMLIVSDLANLTGHPHKIATAVANELLGTDTSVDEVVC